MGRPRVGQFIGTTGYVDDVADAVNLAGTPGTGGGTTDYASEAEAEAGVLTNKAISPATLHAVFQHLEAEASDLDAGTADRWVPSDLFALRVHAIQTALNTKLDITDLFEVARKSIADSALTAAQKEAFNRRIGDDQIVSGIWSDAVYFQRQQAVGQAGVLIESGVVLDPTTTELRLRYAARRVDTGDADATFVITNAQLNALRAGTRRVPSSAILNTDNVISHGFGTPDDIITGYVSLDRNNQLLLGTGQTGGTTWGFFIWQRESNVEPWAERGNTDQIPASKIPGNIFTDALMAKLAGIAAGAEVNVQSNLAEHDDTSDAFVQGQTAFQNRVISAITTMLDGEIANFPGPQDTSSFKEMVQETAPRRDAVLTLQTVGGSDFWGKGRGSLSAPLGEDDQAQTDDWNNAVGGVQWASGTRTLTVYLAQNSMWDRAWINGETHLLIEGGNNTVAWDPLPANARTTYRVASIVLSSIAAGVIDDNADNQISLNFGDTDTTPESFPVGAPFIRRAVVTSDEVVASLPQAQTTSSVEDLVRETAPRRDATLTLGGSGNAQDDNMYWGKGRGSLSAPLGEDGEPQMAEWDNAVGGVRWSSDDRTVTVWLGVGSEWDRAWINGEAHLLIEGGSSTVPWDPSPSAGRTTYRVASVPLSSSAAQRIDDNAQNQLTLNLGDTDVAPEAFPVGMPFVRESAVDDRETAAQVQARIDAVIDGRLYTQAEFDAITDKGTTVRFVS